MQRVVAGLLAALCLAAAPLSAIAKFPEKPIRLIVPYPPGGTTDALARIVGEALGQALGTQIVVDNRGGAGGVLGTEAAARAAPDGYTIVLGNVGPNAINPSLYKKLPYDAEKDFQPISVVATFPLFLVTHPSVPAKNVAELVAYSKAQPKGLSYASVGVGSVSHVTGELFAGSTGARLVHIPYKGGGPAIQDVIAGHVSMMFLGVYDENIRTGRMHLLATSAGKRSTAAPDAPTMAESGVANFDVSSWFGLLAPAGTPRPVIDQLHQALVKVMGEPALRQRVIALGGEPATTTPEEFQALIKAEIPRWRAVVQASGASLD